MVTYKIKYNNSLSHHGILGMKWGVWNDETTARYRGGSKSKSYNKPKEKRKDILNKEIIKKGLIVTGIAATTMLTIYTLNHINSLPNVVEDGKAFYNLAKDIKVDFKNLNDIVEFVEQDKKNISFKRGLD